MKPKVYGSFYLWGDVPALMPMQSAIKNSGGSWFAIDGSGNRGERNDARYNQNARYGVKVPGNNSPRRWEDRDIKRLHDAVGTKPVAALFGANCESSMSRLYGSKYPKRKMASAMIAKIPFPLSQHIARVFKP